MVKPAAPVPSTSSAKSKKPKKPTTKPSKEPAKIADAASSSDDAEAYSELTRIAREESPDPPLATYVPPAGSVPADLDFDVDFGEFDYDAVKAEEGAELWLVRAPIAVKAKNMQGVQVLSSSSSVVGRVGELSRKSTAYDIWSLSTPAPSSSSATAAASIGDGDSHHPHPHVCAEELNGLSVLLPRKRKDGKLFLAPKPITRHLVVTARPAEPTPRPKSGDDTFQNPPREAYPDTVLTHRFRPYGDPGVPPLAPPEDQMDEHEHAEEGVKEKEKGKEKERRKKRRGEVGESPKKVKKVKMAAS